jgi:hypothetical protein
MKYLKYNQGPFFFVDIFAQTYKSIFYVAASNVKSEENLLGFKNGWTLLVEVWISPNPHYRSIVHCISTYSLSSSLELVEHFDTLNPLSISPLLPFLDMRGYAQNFMFPFIFGLLLSDLYSAGVFERIQKKPILNHTIQTLLIILIIGFQILPQSSDSLNKLYNTWSHLPKRTEFLWLIRNRGNNRAYQLPHLLTAMCIVLLLELSTRLKWLFSTRVFKILGKYSFAFYCIHFIVIDSTAISIRQYLDPLITGDDAQVKKAVIVLCVCIIYMVPLCILFEQTADKYGISMGRYVNRMTRRVGVHSLITSIRAIPEHFNSRRNQQDVHSQIKLSP